MCTRSFGLSMFARTLALIPLAVCAPLRTPTLRIPQGRFGTNQEVGAVAAFLAMPASSHIVGDVIHVNGGMLFGS